MQKGNKKANNNLMDFVLSLWEKDFIVPWANPTGKSVHLKIRRNI